MALLDEDIFYFYLDPRRKDTGRFSFPQWWLADSRFPVDSCRKHWTLKQPKMNKVINKRLLKYSAWGLAIQFTTGIQSCSRMAASLDPIQFVKGVMRTQYTIDLHYANELRPSGIA